MKPKEIMLLCRFMRLPGQTYKRVDDVEMYFLPKETSMKNTWSTKFDR